MAFKANGQWHRGNNDWVLCEVLSADGDYLEIRLKAQGAPIKKVKWFEVYNYEKTNHWTRTLGVKFVDSDISPTTPPGDMENTSADLKSDATGKSSQQDDEPLGDDQSGEDMGG